MNFEKLLNEGKIEKVEKTEFDSSNSEKDLDFAKKGMETGNYSRVMAVAYESVLRIGNKLMNYLGYRSIGKEHHKHTFEFLSLLNINQELLKYFDNIRKKRNDFIYRDVENISRKEALEIIENADKLIIDVKNFVIKHK